MSFLIEFWFKLIGMSFESSSKLDEIGSIVNKSMSSSFLIWYIPITKV